MVLSILPLMSCDWCFLVIFVANPFTLQKKTFDHNRFSIYTHFIQLTHNLEYLLEYSPASHVLIFAIILNINVMQKF